MSAEQYDLARIAKLDDVGRFDTLVPEVMWGALGAPDAQSAVEIGAGTGLFAARFVALAPRVTVFAADVDDAMIEYMCRKRVQVASGRLIPVKAEERRVPLPDEIADAVYMINMHHELADPAVTYAEALRLLKPGGRVLAVDWLPIETPKGPPIAIRVSPEHLAEALRRAGFSDAVPVPGLAWHGMAAGTKLLGRS